MRRSARSAWVIQRPKTSSGTPVGAAIAMPRCTATVWASVYLRIPSPPCRRPRPELLEAAHRRLHRPPGGGIGLVDVDGAGVDARRHAAGELGVARPDAGVQAVLRVVGELDRLLVRGERVDRDHRAEGLVGVEQHLGARAGEDRRLEEERSQIGPRPAADLDAHPLGDRVLDVRGSPSPAAWATRASRRRSSSRAPSRASGGWSRARTRRRSGRTATRARRGARSRCRAARRRRTNRAPRRPPRRARSASARTSIGFLPPSSSEQPMSWPPASRASLRPVGVEPVNCR